MKKPYHIVNSKEFLDDLLNYVIDHIKHFRAAKQMGDYLIVSVTGDSNMQKGIGRPLYKEKERIDKKRSIIYSREKKIDIFK